MPSNPLNRDLRLDAACHAKSRPLPERTAHRNNWLYLLLAISFLYNPFLVASVSGSGLNVQHSASHRATVGASELQQLAPMGDQETHPLLDLFCVETRFVSPEASSQPFLPQSHELLAPRELLCPNLWFRPPSTL
jgi:hypothetical protein